MAKSHDSFDGLASDPDIFLARNGSEVNLHDDNWLMSELTEDLNIHFGICRPFVSDEMEDSFRHVLSWYVQNASLSYTRNIFFCCVKFFAFISAVAVGKVTEVTSADILNYKVFLGQNREWYLGYISGFLKKWNRLGYRGVSDEAISLLSELKFKGNPKGVAVATMDPQKGPFTQLEVDAIRNALHLAYRDGRIELDDYILVLIFLTFGVRPVQCAALKIGDFNVDKSSGRYEFYLKIPRAKMRLSAARSEFKERCLTADFGQLISMYIDGVTEKWAGTLKDVAQLPFFIFKRGDGSRRRGTILHSTSSELRSRLSKTLKTLAVKSERTGKAIKSNSYRFRSTIGTRAAEEGHGELTIAELLDHLDTQSVGVYVKATPTIIERIDRAIAFRLAPLAHAFAGKVISNSSEASRDGPCSSIFSPKITGSFEAISSCGKNSPCQLLKPIACYTCSNFEPWLDGPHEQVLNYLLSERERLLKSSDQRIASINDREILAVAEVISICRDILFKRSILND